MRKRPPLEQPSEQRPAENTSQSPAPDEESTPVSGVRSVAPREPETNTPPSEPTELAIAVGFPHVDRERAPRSKLDFQKSPATNLRDLLRQALEAPEQDERWVALAADLYPIGRSALRSFQLSEPEVDDILQDSLLKMLEKRQPLANPGAFYCCVVRTKAVDVYRAKKRKPTESLDDATKSLATELLTADPSPEHQACQREIFEKVCGPLREHLMCPPHHFSREMADKFIACWLDGDRLIHLLTEYSPDICSNTLYGRRSRLRNVIDQLIATLRLK